MPGEVLRASEELGPDGQKRRRLLRSQSVADIGAGGGAAKAKKEDDCC